jgi:hypothetical protein
MCLACLAIIKAKLIDQLFNIVGLTNKDVILHLPDLKHKKNISSLITHISNSLFIKEKNSSARAELVEPNIILSI